MSSSLWPLLFERNALLTINKNYDDEHIQRVLPVALLLLIKRAVLEAGDTIEREDFDLRKRDGEELFPRVEVPKSMISCLLAVDDLLAMLPRLYAKRDRIQAMRERADSEIMHLFLPP